MDNIELIKNCISGNEKARNEFCDLYCNLIYDSIRRPFKQYGVLINNDTIEDLYHDVLVILFDKNCKVLGQFEHRNGCTLASYIRTISVNKAIDYLRKQKPMISLDEEKKDEEGNKISNFIERFLLEREGRKEAISKAYRPLNKIDAINVCNQLFAHLEEREHRFCRLCFIEEKEPEAIARELGISVENVYVRKQRVLDKLKKIVKDKNIC